MSNNVLVQRGKIEEVLSALIEKQQMVINDIDKCLPLMQDAELIKKLTLQRNRAEAQLKALNEGYVPLSGGWFWDIDTKSKWGEGFVKEVLETMPPEVKDIMQSAKESGTFDKIKVNGRRRGDPMLVGTAGNKNFLLAMWANLDGGYAVGFTMKKHLVLNNKQIA